MYLIGIICAIIFPIIYLIQTSVATDSLISAVVFCVATVSVIIIIFAPKISMLVLGGDLDLTNGFRRRSHVFPSLRDQRQRSDINNSIFTSDHMSAQVIAALEEENDNRCVVLKLYVYQILIILITYILWVGEVTIPIYTVFFIILVQQII